MKVTSPQPLPQPLPPPYLFGHYLCMGRQERLLHIPSWLSPPDRHLVLPAIAAAKSS